MINTIINEQATFPSRLTGKSDPDGIELGCINKTIFWKLAEWQSASFGNIVVSDQASSTKLPMTSSLVGELQEAVFIYMPSRWQRLYIKVIKIEDLSCQVISSRRCIRWCCAAERCNV